MINFKFLLQPHQKYNITLSIKNLEFRSLLWWKINLNLNLKFNKPEPEPKDDFSTNSHYLTHTFLFREVGRMYFLGLGVKGSRRCCAVKLFRETCSRKCRDAIASCNMAAATLLAVAWDSQCHCASRMLFYFSWNFFAGNFLTKFHKTDPRLTRCNIRRKLYRVAVSRASFTV